MEAGGLLASSNGDFGLSCAGLYRSDTPNFATKFGWTANCHLSFAVDGADRHANVTSLGHKYWICTREMPSTSAASGQK